MTSKKQKQKANAISQEDSALAQQQFETYHQIANELRQSRGAAQAESALRPIAGLPEGAQMAFVKALSKESKVDAADVLAGINALSPVKEVRKEARRALIHLEASRTYPRWTPPAVPAIPLFNLEAAGEITPARFWKGLVTDTQEAGEVQLVLIWEQGRDYKDARIMGFLLEFWRDGIKDFFTEVGSKSRIEGRLELMRSRMEDVELVDCTLEEGRRLILKAQLTNMESGTVPHSDYVRNISLIQRLLPEVIHPSADDISRSLINASLDDLEGPDDDLLDTPWDAGSVVELFLDAWCSEDFESAYDYLASDSKMKEGLAREEWIARRSAWAEQAHPRASKFLFGVGYDPGERQENLSSGVLPADVLPGPDEVEVLWSLEIDDPGEGTIKELPVATVSYKETGRRWFWANYSAVEEDGEWRVRDMIDKGAELQRLSSKKLQERLQEFAESIRKLSQESGLGDPGEELDEDTLEDEELEEDDEEDEDEDFDEEDLGDLLEVVAAITTRAIHCCDALIKKAPDDVGTYELAYGQSALVQDWERAAAYLELIAERFPEGRGNALRNLALVLTSIAEENDENEDVAGAERFVGLAEEKLRDSIAVDNAVLGHVLLAQMYMNRGERFDEAEAEIREAQALIANEEDEMLVEFALGDIAVARGEHEQAVSHYRRVAEANPDRPGIWFKLGHEQRVLGNYTEAEESLTRSLEVSPEETGAYADLAAIHMEHGDLSKAQHILEQGLELVPDAADLLAALALVYLQRGERSQARDLLEAAEAIDPDLDIVIAVRQLYEAQKRGSRSRSHGRRQSRRR